MSIAKVLLVDDVRIFLDFERPFFERAGCSTLTATSGEEALRLVRDEKPHIVILDYEMPGMNGDEVCRRIKEDPSTRHIPVLMVTTHRSQEVSERCARAGCYDLVSKPVGGRELLEKVVGILQIPYRVHMRTRVTMEVTMGAPADAPSIVGYSDNISEGGMLVETLDPPAEGTRVRLTFKLPSTGNTIGAQAEVVRVIGARAGGMFGVAIQFRETDGAFKSEVRAFVAREIGG